MKISEALKNLADMTATLNAKLDSISTQAAAARPAPSKPAEPEPEPEPPTRRASKLPAARRLSKAESAAETYGRLLEERRYEEAREFYGKNEDALLEFAASSLKPKPAAKKVTPRSPTYAADKLAWKHYCQLSKAGLAREASQWYEEHSAECLRGRKIFAEEPATPDDDPDDDPDSCEACSGSGKVPCATCGGSGKKGTSNE